MNQGGLIWLEIPTYTVHTMEWGSALFDNTPLYDNIYYTVRVLYLVPGSSTWYIVLLFRLPSDNVQQRMFQSDCIPLFLRVRREKSVQCFSFSVCNPICAPSPAPRLLFLGRGARTARFSIHCCTIVFCTWALFAARMTDFSFPFSVRDWFWFLALPPFFGTVCCLSFKTFNTAPPYSHAFTTGTSLSQAARYGVRGEHTIPKHS